MKQPIGRNRWVGRIIGRALVIGIYSVLLVVAADISAVDDAEATASVGAAARAANAPAEIDAVRDAALGAGENVESPLATLAIIGVAGAGVLAARAVRLVRRPRPAAIRPIARRVGTLT